jgi:mevalonate kinase
MTIKNARGSDLIWEALDKDGEVWFDAQVSLYDFHAIKTSDEEIAGRLKKILRAAARSNSEFLSTWSGFKVETQLEFPREWGLGSSSSLLANVAEWADVNPFLLYFDVFNGSGYDIACAISDDAVHFQLGEDQLHFHEIDFKPTFSNKLLFVYRGRKENSESSLKIHGKKFKNNPGVINKVSEISEEISSIPSFNRFKELIDEHEELIGNTLGLPPVKQELFKDFNGSIKSLGAWGGDFMLVASDDGEKYVKEYFSKKGLENVLTYDELIQST